MKVVGLLQNMWVRNPERVKAQIERDKTGQLRERMIHYALFAGCLTGRRLRAAFKEKCDDIVWEECNPTIADNPREYFPPDADHIRAVLTKHNPDLVICFTMAGRKVAKQVCDSLGIRFVPCCHPAARGPEVMPTLHLTALLLE